MAKAAPLGKARLIAKEEISTLLFREFEYFRPLLFQPFSPRFWIQMSRDEASFLIAQTEALK